MQRFTWQDVDGCVRGICDNVPTTRPVSDAEVRRIGQAMRERAHSSGRHSFSPAAWVTEVTNELDRMGLMDR